MVVRSWHPDTRLNGRPFADARLAAGDRLRVGPIEFEVLGPAARTDVRSNLAGPPGKAAAQTAGKHDASVGSYDAPGGTKGAPASMHGTHPGQAATPPDKAAAAVGKPAIDPSRDQQQFARQADRLKRRAARLRSQARQLADREILLATALRAVGRRARRL